MEAQQPLLPGPGQEDSLVQCALKVLECPDPWKKAEYSRAAVKMWREDVIKHIRPVQWQHLRAPDRPARSDDKVRVCAPGEAPRRGKGGTLASRQALLHSAVHIENWAIDLSWDVVARFGLRPEEYDLPRQFFDDFVAVADDECRHFTLLAKRLEEIGSHYGAFAVHDGLWESASNTAHSLPARLAVEHCVHEARGLDVLPATIVKFANNGDSESAALLRDVIYPEEVSHCAAGVRWIKYLHGVAHDVTRWPAGGPVDTTAAVSPAPKSPPSQADSGCNNGGGVASADDGSATAPSVVADAHAVNAQLAQSEGGAEDADNRCADYAANGSFQAGGLSARDSSADGGVSSSSGGGGNEGVQTQAAALPAWVLDARKYGSVEEWFHSLVRAHFWGFLKPPFNEEARTKAGFGPEWYLPLSAQPSQHLQS